MTRLAFMRTTRRIVDSVKEAEAMGFSVMAAPSITIVKGGDGEYVKVSEAASAGRPIVFMTSTAVEECFDHFKGGFRTMFKGPVYASGSAAECLRRKGIESSAGGDGGALMVGDEAKLSEVSDGNKAMVYRSSPAGIGNPLLHIMIAIKRGELDWLAMTSPEAVRFLYGFMDEKYGEDDSRAYMDDNVKIAAVDSLTAEALKGFGREPDLVSPVPTFSGLLEAIKKEG